MYLITGAVGFLACIIFIILIIVFAIRGKSGALPLVGFILSIALFLGSGFLYSRTDPEIGGIRFIEYITEDKSVPPNLEGEWKETVSDKADSYHGIYISGDTIEIYWVSDGGKSKTLYWAGTYEPPTDGTEPYTWESFNDTRRTSAALLATGDSSKEFTYRNGKLSYSASVLGVTTVIRAERQPWGFLDAAADETGDPAAPANDQPALENAASGDLGDFSVQIKNAAVTTDYDGNPAMVITYAWTNNSDATVSPLASVSARAYQDGTELAPAMILDGEVYNSETSISDARPGTTVDVQCAFTLASEASPLTIELAGISGESGNTVSMEIDPAALAE